MNKVFFYKANIVDYVRLVLLIAAFCVASTHPLAFLILYALSQLMDMLDGMAARAYDECSRFGAVLDMVLDRASDSMFFVQLAVYYPAYAPVFGGLALLDLCSHWTHMYAAAVRGTHHKECTNPILKFYYTKAVLTVLCAANEAAWLCLYLIHWGDAAFPYGAVVGKYVAFVALPLAGVKQFISIVQWFDACESLADIDLKEKEEKQGKKK